MFNCEHYSCPFRANQEMSCIEANIKLFNWGVIKVGNTHCDWFSSQFFIQTLKDIPLTSKRQQWGLWGLEGAQLDKLICQLWVVKKGTFVFDWKLFWDALQTF